MQVFALPPATLAAMKNRDTDFYSPGDAFSSAEFGMPWSSTGVAPHFNPCSDGNAPNQKNSPQLVGTIARMIYETNFWTFTKRWQTLEHFKDPGSLH